jgi:hypothetical protein
MLQDGNSKLKWMAIWQFGQLRTFIRKRDPKNRRFPESGRFPFNPFI